MSQRISVAIITKDEEANIRRCVESVKWADEIVIVDSGSTDATVGIAKELGCAVLHRDWDGYANQKNYSLREAKGDWILSLDADEEVTPGLAHEIRKAIESGRADAYDMPRLNSFLGHWMMYGGWHPDRQLRLVKRGAGWFKPLPVHEHIELGESMRLGHLSSPVLHYTYPTVGDFLRKLDRYTSIEAETMVGEGRAPKSLVRALAFAVPLKFAETYVLKQGWRDGIPGFIAAVMTSARVFTRYAKVWEARGK